MKPHATSFDWIYLGSAKVFFNHGLKERAVEALRKATEIDPDSYLAHYQLGIVYRDEAKIEFAINAFKTALDIMPSYAPTLFQLGRLCRIHERNLEKAKAYLLRSVELDPAEYWAHYELGILHRDMGETEAAFDSFHQVLALDPKSIPALQQMGRLFRISGNFKSAIRMFKRALEFKPDDISTMIELGLAYRDSGEFIEAVALYSKILEMDPDNAIAHNHLGCLFRSTDDEQMAEVHLMQATQLSPETAAFHFEYGFFLYEKKEYRRAYPYFVRALELRPDMESASDYLNKIDSHF